MKQHFLRTCTLAAAAIGLFACSDNTNVSPKSAAVPAQSPSYNETTPFNNNGICMANDAVAAPTGTISGIQQGSDPLSATNCTSNDVRIATATVVSYQVTLTDGTFGPVTPFNPGDQVSCLAGTPIKLNINARIEETANSARADIGVWIATDGGNAIVGQCNHYNLTTNPLGTGVTNPDGDHCGDMNSGGVVPSFPLGVIDAICQTSGAANSTVLHVGSCLGWKEPGADTVCPLASSETPDGYRWGTLYANKSKCNCDGFDLPITVQQHAKLEVVKACTPANDPGTFDLKIDNSTTVNGIVVGENKTCGTSTGAQLISAGTNVAQVPFTALVKATLPRRTTRALTRA